MGKELRAVCCRDEGGWLCDEVGMEDCSVDCIGVGEVDREFDSLCEACRASLSIADHAVYCLDTDVFRLFCRVP